MPTETSEHGTVLDADGLERCRRTLDERFRTGEPISPMLAFNLFATLDALRETVNGADLFARNSDDPVQQQVDRLARFILQDVEGEPSQSEGAVDTAIRLLAKWMPQDDKADEQQKDYGNLHKSYEEAMAALVECGLRAGMPQAEALHASPQAIVDRVREIGEASQTLVHANRERRAMGSQLQSDIEALWDVVESIADAAGMLKIDRQKEGAAQGVRDSKMLVGYVEALRAPQAQGKRYEKLTEDLAKANDAMHLALLHCAQVCGRTADDAGEMEPNDIAKEVDSTVTRLRESFRTERDRRRAVSMSTGDGGRADAQTLLLSYEVTIKGLRERLQRTTVSLVSALNETVGGPVTVEVHDAIA